MKKKITLCMVLSTFIICAMLCLTNCSNDDAPTSVFTPEALKQTTWQAQMTVYNIEDEIDYTKQSILQFTNESEGIYTRTNEEDGYMWNTDFTCQLSGSFRPTRRTPHRLLVFRPNGGIYRESNRLSLQMHETSQRRQNRQSQQQNNYLRRRQVLYRIY